MAPLARPEKHKKKEKRKEKSEKKAESEPAQEEQEKKKKKKSSSTKAQQVSDPVATQVDDDALCAAALTPDPGPGSTPLSASVRPSLPVRWTTSSRGLPRSKPRVTCSGCAAVSSRC